MAGKEGMKHYPLSIKAEVVEKLTQGVPLNALSREYGISRWAIYTWSGRAKPREPIIPKRRGQPRKAPMTTERELEIENKRLRMEVDLLRSFLQAAGRR
jgi:transposase-like protein